MKKTMNDRTGGGIRLHSMTRVALMAAVLCVTSQWTIPVGTMPMTMQTFFIALCGALLGGPLGALAALVYLLIGACGLPVFSGALGGPMRFVGPTGGFLIGFPPMALLCGLLSRRGHWAQLLMGLCGLVVLYVVGIAQLMLVSHLTLAGALAACVVPLVLAKDVVVVALGVLLGRAIKRRI